MEDPLMIRFPKDTTVLLISNVVPLLTVSLVSPFIETVLVQRNGCMEIHDQAE